LIGSRQSNAGLYCAYESGFTVCAAIEFLREGIYDVLFDRIVELIGELQPHKTLHELIVDLSCRTIKPALVFTNNRVLATPGGLPSPTSRISPSSSDPLAVLQAFLMKISE
jgi:hypothetical protein